MAEAVNASADAGDIKAEFAVVQSGFESAFADTPPVEPAKVVEEPKVEAEPKTEATPPAPVPEKPKYARVLEQDWNNAKAALGKVAALESQVAKLVGSMPKAEQLVEQVLEHVRTKAAFGLTVDLSDDKDFADLIENYPELAGMHRSSLEAIFKKAKVTMGEAVAAAADDTKPPAGAPSPMDPDAIKKAVADALKEKADADTAAALAKEKDTLVKAYPNYREVIGSPEKDGDPPIETDWRKWLATQPAEYQTEIRETWSWAKVQESIDKFIASTKAPSTPAKPSRADMRRAVNEDAVTPRTDGGAMPLEVPPDAQSAFHKAFGTPG